MSMSPNESSQKSIHEEEKAFVASRKSKFWPFSFIETDKGRKLFIDKKKLLIWLLVLFLAGWVSLFSGLYFFVKYSRGITPIKYTDMLFLPFRYDHYQKVRGDFYIEQAKVDFKNQNWLAAYYKLRSGIERSPSNREGRLMILPFYNLWKRTDLAEKTLLEGIPYNRDNMEFMRVLFMFLLRQQEDEKVISLGKQLLGDTVVITPVNQLIAFAQASAYYYRGHYDKAEDVLRLYKINNMRDGRLLLARIDWDRGFKNQALAKLRRLQMDMPRDMEVYLQLVSYLREDGRDDEARRESIMRSLADPTNSRPRIDLLTAYKKAGERDKIKMEEIEIFNTFSNDENTMLALADFASNDGDAELTTKICEHMKAKGMKWAGAALMNAEALLVSQKYPEAIEALKKLKENPEIGGNFRSIIVGLQAIANFGSGNADGGDASLKEFYSQLNVRTENYIAISKRLKEIGAIYPARQVLAQAVKNDPINQAALTRLVEIDIELNNTDDVSKNVRTLLTMRRPSPRLLRMAYEQLSSDRFIFSEGRDPLLTDLELALENHQDS